MNNSRIELLEEYLEHMIQYMKGGESKGNMLVGPPGVGKTQFVDFLAKLLGLDLIVIEAPHIVEEKLINIPFLVDNARTGAQTKGNTQMQVGKDQFDIVLADSYLFTQITSANPLNDVEYINNIYKHRNLQIMYEAMGGTTEKIPPTIAGIRSHYKVILFIDEFFRSPSPTITTILRTLLNKRLGKHPLPANVYVTYASNIKDTGDSISERQQNQRFNMYEMEPSTKEEWFTWLITKFSDDHHNIKLNMNIINEFRRILDDEDISNDYETTQGEDVGDIVRASPRRWEQLLLYINSSFPVKDERAAKSLITNIKVNFLHYINNEYHPLAKKVVKSVIKLIKQESGITISETDVNSDMEWRNTLHHQIEVKKILGNHRTYIPVISGPPGIGKTSNAASVAEDLNLRLIIIDASELIDPTEVTGQPAPGQKIGLKETITVKFVASKLFKQVNDVKDYEDQKYKADLIGRLGQVEGLKEYREYENNRWKYLILFDELNRCPPQVMNALRRILLEKNFGEKDSEGKWMMLPKEAIVMAAINPVGTGTEKLTHHMRDVMDIIPGLSSWSKQKAFMEQRTQPDEVDQNIRKAVINAFELVSSKFSPKDIDVEQQPFYLDVGGGEHVYITPNDFTDMFNKTCIKVQSTMDKHLKGRSVTDLSTSEIKELEKDLKDATFRGMAPTIRDVFHNHDNLPSGEWLKTFRIWLQNKPEICEELTKVSSSKLTARGDIKSVMETHLTGKNKRPISDDSLFINYLKSKDHVTVKGEIERALSDLVSDPEDAKKYLATSDQPELEYDVEKNKYIKLDEQVPAMFNLFTGIGAAIHVNGFTGEVFDAIVGGMDQLIRDKLRELLRAKPPLITKEERDELFHKGGDIIEKLQNMDV